MGAMLAIAAVVAICWPGEKEPEYQGKKLNYWIERSQSVDAIGEKEAARAAVQQIGTNALPYLLKWMEHVSWSKTKEWDMLWVRLPRLVQGSSPVRKFIWEGHREAALYGFRVLGSQASPAIDDLLRLANSSSEIVATRALLALGAIVRPIDAYLTN